jgi:hypothetical protein
MELLEDEVEMSAGKEDDQDVLSEEMVSALESARMFNGGMKPCNNKSKPKAEHWGPILVDRERRKDDGTKVLQKAMALKQKKNLEPLKGNSFSILTSDYLNKVTRDVDLDLGLDKSEANEIIDNLIVEESENFKKFSEENHEVLLPPNLDLALKNDHTNQPNVDDHVPAVVNNCNEVTPISHHVEGSLQTPKWSEVVRRGNSKTMSRTENNVNNEKRVLEY